jgi:hypothetical protein
MGECVGHLRGRQRGRRARRAALPVMVGLLRGGKFAREQIAQHVGDGDAAPERGDLDAAAQLRRDVDGQPRGEAAASAIASGSFLGGLDPAIGIAGPGGEAASVTIGRSLMRGPPDAQPFDLGGRAPRSRARRGCRRRSRRRAGRTARRRRRRRAGRWCAASTGGS